MASQLVYPLTFCPPSVYAAPPLALRDGLEPPFTDSKSVVLPLDDPRLIGPARFELAYLISKTRAFAN